MTANGSGRSTDSYDQFVRIAAELKVSIDGMKAELRTVAPRLDTLTAEVKALGEKLHRNSNALQALADEKLELQAARVAFEGALKEMRIDTKARALEFERTQKEFAHALEVVEGRVRQMRDDMADAIAAANEEASGVKQRM
jgi:chromosome segregation ATPase